MEPDDPLCLCFHVSFRKIANYIRIEKPKRVSQIAECGGAGTGCGWCRPFLKTLFEHDAHPESRRESEVYGATLANRFPAAAEYGQRRSKYVKQRAPDSKDDRDAS